jgi:hypothetical protein
VYPDGSYEDVKYENGQPTGIGVYSTSDNSIRVLRFYHKGEKQLEIDVYPMFEDLLYTRPIEISASNETPSNELK